MESLPGNYIEGPFLPNKLNSLPQHSFVSCCSVSLFVESIDPSVFMAYACGICTATLFRDIPNTAGERWQQLDIVNNTPLMTTTAA
jgi:hypothetical protein